MKTSRFFVWTSLVIIAFATFFAIGFGVYAYRVLPKDDVSRKILDIIPYPAIIVDTSIISISEFYNHYEVINQVENTVALTLDTEIVPEDERFEIAVSKAIDDQMIYVLAEEYGIYPTSEEIDMYSRELFSQYIAQSGSDLETVVEEVYGVSLSDFQEHFVKPLYHFALLNEYIDSEGVVADQRSALADLLADIQNGEITFADAAREYSNDDTAEEGGDLGYFSQGTRVPLIDTFAFSQGTGALSDVLEDSSGLYLLYLEDKKEIEIEDGSEEQARVRVIYIEKMSVEDLIEQKKESVYIKSFIN